MWGGWGLERVCLVVEGVGCGLEIQYCCGTEPLVMDLFFIGMRGSCIFGEVIAIEMRNLIAGVLLECNVLFELSK
jgi:hypothetical protein